MLIEVAGRASGSQVRRTGSFGLLRAEDATPLALVLTELLTNAVEHGLGDGAGEVLVAAERDLDADGLDVLRVEVGDDGAGLPAAFDPAAGGLGLQIVQALVRELRGTIAWAPRARAAGTLVTLELRPRPLGRSGPALSARAGLGPETAETAPTGVVRAASG